jgi:lipoate-protein ligase B|tara:strand:- start:493 stop:1140 length:648 start_codon:yes stop_codon:yes gene_type:complete
MTNSRCVDIRYEGIVNYEEAIGLMKSLQKQRIEEEINDTMLILEHPEIVTVGPRARNDGISAPPGYETFPVDRGGGLTWHGEGQIVCYPIFKWNLDGEDSVASIISKIEDWVISSLTELDIPARKDERMQGVWVGQHKICSIGLSFLRWTSRHGFTINVDTPPGRVENLSGCGLGAATTTSLARLGYKITKKEIISVLLDSIENSINRKIGVIYE